MSIAPSLHPNGLTNASLVYMYVAIFWFPQMCYISDSINASTAQEA